MVGATAQLGLLATLVVASFAIEAASGFGSMVVALTVGAAWFQVSELLAWLVPVNLVLSTWLVVANRRAVAWRFLGARMLPVMLLGLGAGVVVAKAGSPLALKLAFGLFVVAASALLLKDAAAKTAPAPLPGWGRALGLFGAGVVHGVFATGGPLAVFVTARELPDKAAFRATLSVLWAVLNVLLVGLMVRDGAVNAGTLRTSALLLPALGLGLGAGELVHRRLDEERFRAVVAALLLVAGLVLSASSWRALA